MSQLIGSPNLMAI